MTANQKLEHVQALLGHAVESLSEKLNLSENDPAAHAFGKFGEALIELALEKSGALSNQEVLEALYSGQIMIHPFSHTQLNPSSYDVRIGEWYYTTDESRHHLYLNPYSRESVLDYFGGTEPKRAIPYGDWKKRYRADPSPEIPDHHPVITIAPFERILGHTHEHIGIGPPGTSNMQARSTWGRLGFQFCEDAGWGDPGYKYRWTMEIHNQNHRSTVIPVGARVAQIAFFHTGNVLGEYSTDTGKYQRFFEPQDFFEKVRSWSPQDMLPKSYKDEIEEPLPL